MFLAFALLALLFGNVSPVTLQGSLRTSQVMYHTGQRFPKD